MTKNDGEVISGRLTAQSEVDITISVTDKKEVRQLSISLADIKRAQVEIEFNRKGSDE